MSSSSPLIFVGVMFIKAYLDLSAYSDIAIGLSALFGFRIRENFDRPFLKRNLAEFWRGWHVSLSGWCRNNIYFPVFGLTRRPIVAIYACMLAMGLWHQLSLNWATWGLYHATGLSLLVYWERYKKRHPSLRRFLQSPILQPVGYVVTFWYVAFGYSFVWIPDHGRARQVFASCFKALTALIS